MRKIIFCIFVMIGSICIANVKVEDKIANGKFTVWQHNPKLLRVLSSVQNPDGTSTLEIPQVNYQGKWFSIFSGYSSGEFVLSDYIYLQIICKAFGFNRYVAMNDVFTVDRGDFIDPISFEYASLRIDPLDKKAFVSEIAKGVSASITDYSSNGYTWISGQSIANTLNCK